MPRGKIDRPLAGVDKLDGWLQFRAQVESDSPEHANVARMQPRPVKLNPKDFTMLAFPNMRDEPDSLSSTSG